MEERYRSPWKIFDNLRDCVLRFADRPWLGTNKWQLGFKNSENEDFSYLLLQKKDCTMLLVVTHWENKRDKAHSIETDCEELLRKPIHTIVTEEQN